MSRAIGFALVGVVGYEALHADMTAHKTVTSSSRADEIKGLRAAVSEGGMPEAAAQSLSAVAAQNVSGFYFVRGSGLTVSGCDKVWPFADRRTVNDPVSIGCWRPNPPPPPPPRPAAGGGGSRRSQIQRCMPA